MCICYATALWWPRKSSLQFHVLTWRQSDVKVGPRERIRKFNQYLIHAIQNTNHTVFWQVTADGSIDCQNCPDQQESITAALHYTEAVVAMSVLAPGGSCVLKMFTMFENNAICLMYLLNASFGQVIACDFAPVLLLILLLLTYYNWPNLFRSFDHWPFNTISYSSLNLKFSACSRDTSQNRPWGQNLRLPG